MRDYDLCGFVRNSCDLFSENRSREKFSLVSLRVFKTSRLHPAILGGRTHTWKMRLLISTECSHLKFLSSHIDVALYVVLSRNAIALNYLLIYRYSKDGNENSSRSEIPGCVKCSSKCKSNNIGSLRNSVVSDRSTFSHTTLATFREIPYSTA